MAAGQYCSDLWWLVGLVIFRFKKSNFPFQKNEIPFQFRFIIAKIEFD